MSPQASAFARTSLACALIVAVALSPVAVGALGVLPDAFAGAGLAVFAVYAFARAGGAPRAKQVAVVPPSPCSGVTLFDLAARPVLLHLSSVRPSERYLRRWPPLPLLQRYAAGVNSGGPTYGDLAAVSGRADWREWHPVRFVTDERGFRNEPAAGGHPLDLIVPGDSFGVAAATTQGETLSGLLARDYGLGVYNLSVSRESPQQEYGNLLLEGWRPKPALLEESRREFERSGALLWWPGDRH